MKEISKTKAEQLVKNSKGRLTFTIQNDELYVVRAKSRSAKKTAIKVVGAEVTAMINKATDKAMKWLEDERKLSQEKTNNEQQN